MVGNERKDCLPVRAIFIVILAASFVAHYFVFISVHKVTCYDVWSNWTVGQENMSYEVADTFYGSGDDVMRGFRTNSSDLCSTVNISECTELEASWDGDYLCETYGHYIEDSFHNFTSVIAWAVVVTWARYIPFVLPIICVIDRHTRPNLHVLPTVVLITLCCYAIHMAYTMKSAAVFLRLTADAGIGSIACICEQRFGSAARMEQCMFENQRMLGIVLSDMYLPPFLGFIVFAALMTRDKFILKLILLFFYELMIMLMLSAPMLRTILNILNEIPSCDKEYVYTLCITLFSIGMTSWSLLILLVLCTWILACYAYSNDQRKEKVDRWKTWLKKKMITQET